MIANNTTAECYVYSAQASQKKKIENSTQDESVVHSYMCICNSIGMINLQFLEFMLEVSDMQNNNSIPNNNYDSVLDHGKDNIDRLSNSEEDSVRGKGPVQPDWNSLI